MPPSAGPKSPTGGAADWNSNIVTIDVGGEIFQTTKQTLAQAGPDSIMSKISNAGSSIPFVDRDPELFSIMLSLLRTGNLPSKTKSFDMEDLILESRFYGIEHLLVNTQSDPAQFDAFTLEKSLLLPMNGRDSPSAISTTPHGSLHVAHGSKITSFDWSLRRKSTILTHFTAVDSLLAFSPGLAAAGATDFSGLQILDLYGGSVKETLTWENATKSGSTVQAIGASIDHLFTSFESTRRNSNCILVYDIHSLLPIAEIGHYEIFGANLDSAIPATKLQWVSSHSLLMASGSHSGLSGVTGTIKLWDLRSAKVVWQIKETNDCFSDVAFSKAHHLLFKVGINTAEVFCADFRHMDGDHSWVSLGDGRRVANGKKEGIGCRVESHGNQVFCTKGGDIELWTEVLVGSVEISENGVAGRVFRKNLMGRGGGNRITNVSFSGSKMFVARRDQQCVEVWS